MKAQELRDLRAKITVETDAVLDCLSKVTGKDRSEIVRDWLHEKSSEYLQVQKLLHARLKAEGISGSEGL